MVLQKVTIHNPSGLHARPASILAKAARECESCITLIYNEKRISAKSVIEIMAAAIKCDSEVIIECDGEKEEEELGLMASLIENGLRE